MGDDRAVFRGLGPLRGRVRVPGDKSISHRALLLAGLAEGTSHLDGLGDGDDIVRTGEALAAMGVGFEGDAVHGGRSRLREAERPIDLGNSGTGTRLLTGVVSSLPFLTVLYGDASLHTRPMDRITVPLRAMGAGIDGRDHGRLPPLVVRGGDLHGIDHTPEVASAQVKASILFAGLWAEGETVLRERIPTRRHTEEMFAYCGVDVATEEGPDGYAVRVRRSEVRPFDLSIPGDPSQAAFFAVAAAIVAGSEVTIERVYVGPGRAGFLDVLERMGADVELTPHEEHVADITVRHSALRATDVGGREIPGLIDEIPILCVAAACAEGTTTFRDAAELRVKESDRIETMTKELTALGANVEALPDGIVVHGPQLSPRGAVAAHLDHRVAMSLAIAALTSDEEVAVEGFSAVDSSWPSFSADLAGLSWR